MKYFVLLEYMELGLGIISSISCIIFICLIISIGLAVWYSKKSSTTPINQNNYTGPPAPSGPEFEVSIINKTGISLVVTMPDGTTKTFAPEEKYPPTGTTTIRSGTSISYQILADVPPTLIPFTNIANGLPGATNAQTWYLTKGGIMRSTITFRVTNNTNTQDSCCSGGSNPNSVTFQPYVMWNTNPLLTQKLPDIAPGQSVVLTHFMGGDKYIPIEFRYPFYNKNPTDLPYKVWKLEGIDIRPNMNVNLLLNQYCDPLYPTAARCDGTTPASQNPLSLSGRGIPSITFKYGQGKGSNTPGANIPFGSDITTPNGKNFCIATDLSGNGVITPAGTVLFCTAMSPDPSTWAVPIDYIVNNKLYVGSGTNTDNIIYGKNAKGNMDPIPYTTCFDPSTSYTLYVWGGNQGNTDQCPTQNPPTNKTCKVVPNPTGGNGYYTCIGHLSTDAGNLKDPCNDSTSSGNCTLDADCSKCWEPRFCNNTDFTPPKCDVVRSQTQKCTRDAMCGNGLKCNNGYCGTSPIGGTCKTLSDCIQNDGWCYNGKCIAKSSDGGPCDPTIASATTCLRDYCCKTTANPPWTYGELKQKCPPAYDGTDKCSVISSQADPKPSCRQCTDYVSNTNPPNPYSCPGDGMLAICGNGLPVNTCSLADTVFVEDSQYPNTGLCIKCPTGYVMNPKYKINNKWSCPRISTNSNTPANTGCPDMCIPAAGSSGAVCQFNQRQACVL